MMSKLEHEYQALRHTVEFQQKEYSLEKATLKAKVELATKRLNEASQYKTNAMRISNELDMVKAEMILLKNENITLNQNLTSKEAEIKKLNTDILSYNYSSDMNKAELVIVRQELKDFNERYTLKENETINLSSDLLKLKEELKRALDAKEEITRKLVDRSPDIYIYTYTKSRTHTEESITLELKKEQGKILY